MKEYTDIEKAQWILENGIPDLGWIMERVDDMVYRRRINRNGLLPPWISTEREEYYKVYSADNDHRNYCFAPYIPDILHTGEIDE